MVEISNVKPGEKVADLGSGDARISIAFAKAGAQVVGFELESKLIKKAQGEIIKENLQEKVQIMQFDFWDVDLSSYDIVCIYPMPDIMEDLEKKLRSELKEGARVLTNYYEFPNWKHKKTKNKVYLYVK